MEATVSALELGSAIVELVTQGNPELKIKLSYTGQVLSEVIDGEQDTMELFGVQDMLMKWTSMPCNLLDFAARISAHLLDDVVYPCGLGISVFMFEGAWYCRVYVYICPPVLPVPVIERMPTALELADAIAKECIARKPDLAGILLYTGSLDSRRDSETYEPLMELYGGTSDAYQSYRYEPQDPFYPGAIASYFLRESESELLGISVRTLVPKPRIRPVKHFEIHAYRTHVPFNPRAPILLDCA